jgi:hypothetical protein
VVPKLRNASSLSNVIGILDAISSDMRVAVNVAASISKDPTPTLLWTGGLLVCPGGQKTTCKKEEMRMIIPESLTFYPNGTSFSADGPGPFLTPIRTSMINTFVALQDAYQYVHALPTATPTLLSPFSIDFGNIQSSNVYLDNDAFATFIKPDPTLTNVTRKFPEANICSWGVGCVQLSTWAEQLLVGDPNINAALTSVLPTGNMPVIIKVDYLCSNPKIKVLAA